MLRKEDIKIKIVHVYNVIYCINIIKFTIICHSSLYNEESLACPLELTKGLTYMTPQKFKFKGRVCGAFSALQPKADCTLTQMSSFVHLQRRHAPYRRERPLLAKEGTITKEFC